MFSLGVLTEMRYGKIISGGCLVRESPAEGYKPIIDTTPETRQDYRAVFHYEDNGEAIVSVWEYVELTEDEKAERDIDMDAVTAEEIAAAIEEALA